MKISHFLILPLLLMASEVIAQNELTDKQVLKLMKADKIEWHEDFGEKMAKVYFKKSNKWGLYKIDTYLYEEEYYKNYSFYEEIVPPEFDSLGWFSDYDYKFTIVKQKDKYGLLLYPGEFYDALDRVYCDFDEIIVKEPETDSPYSSGYDSEIYVLVKYDGKWGLMDWMTGTYIFEPVYGRQDEVPLVFVAPGYLNEFFQIRDVMNIDKLEFDNYNGDGNFKALDSKNKKWGLFQGSDGRYNELIPSQFDSIDFFTFNGPFTGVYNNGKVGIYLSRIKYNAFTRQTVACTYEDYRIIKFNDIPYVAMQKNGKWGWVNWLTGEEKSEFISSAPEELPNPGYEQTNWMED